MTPFLRAFSDELSHEKLGGIMMRAGARIAKALVPLTPAQKKNNQRMAAAVEQMMKERELRRALPVARMLPARAGVKLGSESMDSSDLAFREAKRETRRQPSRDGALRALRGDGTPVSRNYLASMLIGGISVPAVAIMSKRISRALNNKAVQREMRSLGPMASMKKVRALRDELHTGPSFGRARPGTPMNTRPLITHGEAAGLAASGVASGGLVQIIRDHFSGSAPTTPR